ncbi:MAG: response regulator transcription factor [Propionivibrio sp.]
MIHILIVDDHAIVGFGLKQFLHSIGGFELSGEARSGMEALEMLKKRHWDLMLLDVGLPDMNGVEVLKRVKREQPQLPVLMFSMYPEDEYAMAALEAGALGYLTKDSSPDEILGALRRASAGERYLSPTLSEKLLSRSLSTTRRMPHDTFSRREFEVMRLLGQGKPITEIAKRLFLSPKTVTTYRARVLEKLGVQNNAELTRYMLEHKLGL